MTILLGFLLVALAIWLSGSLIALMFGADGVKEAAEGGFVLLVIIAVFTLIGLIGWLGFRLLSLP